MKKMLSVVLIMLIAFPILASVVADSITVPMFSKYEQNPVLMARKAKPGEVIYFDSSAVTDPCVIYWQGKYHMWYTGWINWMTGKGRQGRIGYAISPDGKTWTRVEGNSGGIEAQGAVLGTGTTNDFDGMSAESPCVINDDGRLRMYYVGVDTKGRMSIGLAESMTGNYWTKKGLVLYPTNETAFDSYQIGKCWVVKANNVYRMWYEAQSKADSRWRIGYANSYDGTTWTKQLGEKSGGAVLDLGEKITDFDHLAIRSPSVVYDGVYYFMWYDTSMRDEKTSQIGIAVSVNGTTWEKRGVSLDVGKIGEFDAQRVTSASILKVGLVFKMWYCNYSDTNSGIGLATSGDIPVNIGSGIVKLDCKAGDGFDFSLGNKTKDPTLADFLFDCGFGSPRMCGRWIKVAQDFDSECVPCDGYPNITSIREQCNNIEVGTVYAFKTISEQNYAKIKIEGVWQDPVDPTHYEVTVKWMYQSNGSCCFIGGTKEPPPKPYNVTAIGGDRVIKLLWTKSFTPPGRIISYYVYRASEPDQAAKSRSPIHDFPVSETQFVDTGLTNNKTYCYIVRAVDQFGNISEPSNEACTTPKPIHPPSFPPPPPINPEDPSPPGKGTPEDPYIVETNPYVFDWCGFVPQTVVIINGAQFAADGDGCIHVSIILKLGLNVIQYTIITPTGETISDSIALSLKDTNVNLELWIAKPYMMRNDQRIELDVKPEIKQSRTFIPFRAVAEALNCEVEYNDLQKKVTVKNCLNKIELWIGKPTAVVNGQPIPIDSSDAKVVPYIVSGRTMVPFRFIAETLGANVNWIAEEKKVTVLFTPPNCPKTP